MLWWNWYLSSYHPHRSLIITVLFQYTLETLCRQLLHIFSKIIQWCFLVEHMIFHSLNVWNGIMDLHSVIFRTLFTSLLPDPPQPSSSSQSPLICSSTLPPLPVCRRSQLSYLRNDLPRNSWRQDMACKLVVQMKNFEEHPRFLISLPNIVLILKEKSRIHRKIILTFSPSGLQSYLKMLILHFLFKNICNVSICTSSVLLNKRLVIKP